MEIKGNFNRVAGRDYYDIRLTPKESDIVLTKMMSMEILKPSEKALLYYFRTVNDTHQASILAILADIAMLRMLDKDAANDV